MYRVVYKTLIALLVPKVHMSVFKALIVVLLVLTVLLMIHRVHWKVGVGDIRGVTLLLIFARYDYRPSLLSDQIWPQKIITVSLLLKVG